MTDLTPSCRLVILISGRGSNMQAIVSMIEEQGLPAQVCAVISNQIDAEGVNWAKERGVATACISHRDFATRADFDQALLQEIDNYQPDYVLLAGFMRVLSPFFVEHYHGRLINIHPSLLPSFPGLRTHEQALEAGVQCHGSTVHFVTPVLDHGPIIAQSIVPVLASDTPDTLAERVLATEHVVYTEAVRWLIQGQVHLDAHDKVQVNGLEQRSFYFHA